MTGGEPGPRSVPGAVGDRADRDHLTLDDLALDDAMAALRLRELSLRLALDAFDQPLPTWLGGDRPR